MTNTRRTYIVFSLRYMVLGIVQTNGWRARCFPLIGSEYEVLNEWRCNCTHMTLEQLARYNVETWYS